MIHFDAPLLLLLAPPALYLVWRLRSSSWTTTTLRAAIVLLAVVALAGPLARQDVEGRDLILVVDRSRSMPAGTEAAALERIRLAEQERSRGDRVGVVTFGANARIEALPDENSRAHPFGIAVEVDGSDLAEGIDTALELLSDERAGSLLILSDGEVKGRDPLPAARRARARGIPVHVLPLSRPPITDVSVERLELPSEVGVGEPFQFSAWVRADQAGTIAFALLRDADVLSRGTRDVRPGWNRLLFRDVLTEPGLGVYRLRIEQAGDRVPENDFGLGAVLVRGTKPLLVLNHDGAPDTLTEAWRSAGLELEVARPEDAKLDPLSLARYRAVVLENVAARRVEHALPALAEFVVERGGGLLMTGGKASFGIGGYHGTPIDPLLPVSMMLKDEDRKVGVAIAFVLDRSGSMAAAAGDGMTKMDLANLGTMAAIELLSPLDAISVIAVDSSPHVVFELTPVEDPEDFRPEVLSIQSMGGGIFVRTGLDAAIQSLAQATHQNRHIVLFADAADAEEPNGVRELAAELHDTANTSLSVIALGTEFDSDARFLTETAQAGGGAIYFSTNAAELPAMFARDTMTIARSAFLEEPTDSRVSPTLFALGELSLDAFPTVGGYNLNYTRPGADVGVTTTDEHASPLFAFGQQGLGRVAALGCEIGGRFGENLVTWEDSALFFVTLGRWLAGQEEPEAFYPTVVREGRELVLGVEVDRDAELAPDTSALTARIRAPGGDWSEVALQRVGADRFEVRVPLTEEGVHLGTLSVPGLDGKPRVVTLPPLALPYSPEFERPFSAEAGESLMRELARAGGGEVAPVGAAVWPTGRPSGGVRVLSRPLALAALLLVLLEIAGRRLGLWSSLTDTARRRQLRRAAAPAEDSVGRPTPAPQRTAPGRADPPRPARQRQPQPAARGSALDALTSAKQRSARRTDRTDDE